MKKIKKYFKITIGALFIAIALNLFFINRPITATGVFGFSLLYHFTTEMNLALVIFLTNVFFLALGFITVDHSKLKKAVLPSILVPIFVLLTSNISTLVDITDAEFILIVIFGGALTSLGIKMIYRENYLVSGADILDLIGKEIIGPNYKIINYFLDVVWVILCAYQFGFENALYSILIICIIEMTSYRSSVGVSSSKVFYIITKKELAVKSFIMNELKCDLTVFDVKGGFSKNKNHVLMAAIPTKDYYKLRESIKKIDENAFISITDSYEVINQSAKVKKKINDK